MDEVLGKKLMQATQAVEEQVWFDPRPMNESRARDF